jgi:hypothetical protein
MLRLPPGEYDVRADPPRRGSDCVRTLTRLTVADRPADQTQEVRVTRGCVLILEAVDETTGKGVPDVTFMEESVDHPGIWQSAQVSTAYVENARTDENGQLRAVVPPGKRTYAVGHIAELEGYPQQRPEKRVTLIGGETVKVRFKLHK